MSVQAGVGMSHHRNPREAGRQAAQQAIKAAGIKQAPDFVFMFASIGYEQHVLLRAVREATGGAALCGCSGEGVITTNEADESYFSVAVMVISSDEFHFSNGMTAGLKADPAAAGDTIGQAIQSQLNSESVGLFLFPDGFTFNFDRFVSGLEKHVDRHLPLFGGSACNDLEMIKHMYTYQYCNDDVISDGVAWALLSGKARVAWAVNHGCIPIPNERKITRCDGNVIYEIDGKPMLQVLKEYLDADEIDNWTKATTSLCLAFKVPPDHTQDYDEYRLSFMPAKDDATGAVTISSEVSQGTSLWMARRDQEKIAHGIDRIADQIKEQLGGNKARLILHFDCAGRGKMIFREQQKLQLLKTLQQKVGIDTPWLGFYTMGEIGPVGGHNWFHTYTAVIVAIY